MKAQRPRPIPRLIHAVYQLVWSIAQPLTLGVKALLIRDGHVLLVSHSYQPGWYLPGGGVRRRETLEEAIRREAMEEVGATLGTLRLFGVYSNFDEGKNDHVIVFLGEEFGMDERRTWEISGVCFMPIDDLPADATPATRRRLQEYRDGTWPAFGPW